jgi:hypothetical protein
MNPFVNPNKRSVTLPDGCKDLIDVLKRPNKERLPSIRQFILLILFQAHQDRATELIIGVASPDGLTLLRYKTKDVWQDLGPFPSHIRPDVISELLLMAGFPKGVSSGEGILEEKFGGLRERWKVTVESAEGECKLSRIPD